MENHNHNLFREQKKKLTVINWLILCTRFNILRNRRSRVSSFVLHILLLERKPESFPGKSMKTKIVTFMHECVESPILISSEVHYSMACLN